MLSLFLQWGVFFLILFRRGFVHSNCACYTGIALNTGKGHKPSRLVDWLRVPTPMRENCVCAWVEVVDSLQCINTRGIAEFNEMREIFNISGATLRKRTESKQLTRGKPDV